MLKTAIEIDPSIPANARPFVLELLQGRDMHEVMTEAVNDHWTDGFVHRIGHWVDCARIEEIEAGDADYIEDAWMDEALELIQLKEEQERNASDAWERRTFR